jgi:DNA polymerase-4
MDAFFASVEQAHHARLRGQPVIVCGDPDRRGVVTAASYEARPFGVRAGMPLAEARRLCPQAEYVEGNPQKYVELSLRLLDLYVEFSPDVEPFSVDEAFVGLGPECPDLASAGIVAGEIQRRVLEGFGLGASIGVGPNKLVAKMASGLHKPRGLTVLDEAAFRRTFWPSDVQEMWGIGPRLAERMREIGIRTVGDLAKAPESSLKSVFGIIGPQLREAANGHDETPLVPYHRGLDAKSAGHEVTLPEDCDQPEYLEGTLLRLADQVARRLRGEGYVGRIVTLKLRDRRFQTFTRQRALSAHTADGTLIFETARRLFREHWKGGPVRLLGISISSLGRGKDELQPSLFDLDERSLRLRNALDRVRDRLGESSVVPLGSLIHRRTLGHVPFGRVRGSRVTRRTPGGSNP